MMNITRKARFYLGQGMRLHATQTVAAVTSTGDAVILDKEGDCLCHFNHTEEDADHVGRRHRHVAGMFTPEQVRDAAIHSLCEIGGWTVPAGIAPKVE
jgi:hypothetical protein